MKYAETVRDLQLNVMMVITTMEMVAAQIANYRQDITALVVLLLPEILVHPTSLHL